MYTFEQIQQLISQGFTPEFIMSQVPSPAVSGQAPEPVPAPAPVIVPDKVPEPVPAPAPAPEPVPAPATEPPKADASNAQVLQAIEKLTQAVQANALANAQNKVPQTMTDEEAMAQILNPFTHKPITEKGV